MNHLIKTICLLFSILFSLPSSSQVKKDRPKSVTVTKTEEPKDSGFIAQAYYSVFNSTGLITKTVWGSSFADMMKRADSLGTGDPISIMFTDIRSGIARAQPLPVYIYDRHPQTKALKKAADDFAALRSMRFDKGTISFSGSFSPAVTIDATDAKAMKEAMSKSVYGVIVTMRDCVPKNPDGSLGMVINKTITVQ